MVEELKGLADPELELMLKTPVLITVLIAGADSKIDRSEIKEAISLSRMKQQRARKQLIPYFKQVSDTFESDLKSFMDSMPKDVAERNPIIISELEKLNSILPKLDTSFASKFYHSMKDFAKKVAEASGGVLGYMSVGYEESKLIGLKMIKEPSA